MEVEILVQRITAEVLKYIYGNGSRNIVNKYKRILILDQDGEQLKNEIASNTKISFEQTDDLAQFAIHNIFDEYEWIVVPALTIDELAHAALGIRKEGVCDLISKGLLLGKKILVLEEGIEFRKYEATASSRYYDMLKNYEEKLVEFGVSIIDREELYSCLQEKEFSEYLDVSSIHKECRKVIVERHLEGLYASGHKKIEIENRTIITPLALDFAKAKKMEIIRQVKE